MQTLIKGARLLDPGNIDGKKDIIIKDHIIEAIVDPNDIETKTYFETRPDTKIIDGL